MTPDQFAQALESLRGYWGVIGCFGGNPAASRYFLDICNVFRGSWVPKNQRGIWCNNPLTLECSQAMRETFDCSISNLNVHLDRKAYELFKQGWPECNPVGLDRDSRHSPPFVAMKDVVTKTCPRCKGSAINPDEIVVEPDQSVINVDCPACEGTGKVPDEPHIWELISNCDINRHWSAGIGVFRGQLRAFFCEVAMTQALLHQHDPDYPDTGLDPIKGYDLLGNFLEPPNIIDDNGRRMTCKELGLSEPLKWWQLPMIEFRKQVRKHCFDCGVPLRGHGELAQSQDPDATEQVSETHRAIYNLKDRKRPLQLVTDREQLGKPLEKVTHYLQNASK